MADDNQNPGRKWRKVENDGDGDRYFDSYRYTPYSTDLEFYRDPNIYQSGVSRTTQAGETEPRSSKTVKPRGLQRTDEEIKKEIESLLRQHGQVDARQIQVDVRQGVVTLSGNVTSPFGVQTAEGIARNVFGVLEINNQLNFVSGR
jgi:hypothetical protein